MGTNIAEGTTDSMREVNHSVAKVELNVCLINAKFKLLIHGLEIISDLRMVLRTKAQRA